MAFKLVLNRCIDLRPKCRTFKLKGDAPNPVIEVVT
jgi:hypothetical protein